MKILEMIKDAWHGLVGYIMVPSCEDCNCVMEYVYYDDETKDYVYYCPVCKTEYRV